MVCVQCGTVNDDHSKYCASCNAVLFQPAPVGAPETSTLDLEEDVDYPVPETHYHAPILQHLAWSVHEFLEEGADLEPVIDAYEAYREVFENFRTEIPSLKEYYYSQTGFIEGDPVPSQIKYLVTKAEELYVEGEKLFEAYFDTLESLSPEEDFPDPEPLISATKCWLSCNDNVCVCFDFLVGRLDAFGEMIQDLQDSLLAAEAEEAEEAKAASAPAQESESPSLGLEPLDRSDV